MPHAGIGCPFGTSGWLAKGRRWMRVLDHGFSDGGGWFLGREGLGGGSAGLAERGASVGFLVLGKRTGKSVLRWGCPLKDYGALSGLGVFVGVYLGRCPRLSHLGLVGPVDDGETQDGREGLGGLVGRGASTEPRGPGLVRMGVIGERRAGATRCHGWVRDGVGEGEPVANALR
jgi:hypothetical protein